MRSLVLALATAGCASHPHQRLSAPPRGAPGEVRLAAYERLRAAPELAYRDETLDHLRLGDGTEVRHAEDILTVVPPRSRAAAAAESSRAASRTSTALLVGGSVAAGLGLGLTIASWSEQGDRWPEEDPLVSTLAFSALAAGIVAAALSAIPEWHANDATSAAFRAYDRALRRRLDLCVEGFEVVDCAGPEARPGR